MVAGIKLDPEYVRSEIENAGFTLLETYKNAMTPMSVICPNGHDWKLQWSNWRNGSARCPYCSGKRIHPSEVKNALANEGFEMLSEYEGIFKHFQFRCPKGHIHTTTYDMWKKGQRCGVCRGNHRKHDEAAASFESEGYTLLSEYKNTADDLEFLCPQGHKSKMTYARWLKGCRCGVCWNEEHSLSESFVIEELAKEGFTLASPYITSKIPFKVICPNGHLSTKRWNNWYQGSRCQSCAMRGFNPDKPGTLYYLRFEFDGAYYYKIGITNRTVKQRYYREPLPYTEIMTKTFLFGNLAFEEEQAILKKHKKHRYKGNSILLDGNSELFIKDVLRLDKC